MGVFDWVSDNPLSAGMLGLGALSTGFGALSQYNQAQQLNQIRSQALRQQQLMNDPAYVSGLANQYYQQQVNQFTPQVANIMRSTVNPMLGARGIDPSGGQGQLILEQALAPYYANMLGNAYGYAQGGLSGGLNALQLAGQNVQQPYGATGGLGQSLESMMLMQALQRKNTPADVSGPSLTGYGGGMNPLGLDGGAGQVLPPRLDLGIGSNPYGLSAPLPTG